MRICVEASAALHQTAGIGRYARNLLERVIPLRPEDEWTLVHAPSDDGSRVRGTGSIDPGGRLVKMPFNRRRADQIWHRARVPLDIRLMTRSGTDLMYSPDFTAPPAFGVPRIITVHDLAFLTHPQFATEALRKYLGTVVPRQAKSADGVVVVSEATRRDVIDYLGVDEGRVRLVRNGVDRRFLLPAPLTASARADLGLPDQYILMVGTLEPRKNHQNALAAIERFRPGSIPPLVIAGRAGWGYEAITKEADRLSRRGQVIRVDFVEDHILPSLYRDAAVVLYPSWTEGFGLPVLEALGAGSSVITGTAPALREAGGSLAAYVEPGDVEAIAHALEVALAHDVTEDEREARAMWAGDFSWDNSARELAGVFSTFERGR